MYQSDFYFLILSQSFFKESRSKVNAFAITCKVRQKDKKPVSSQQKFLNLYAKHESPQNEIEESLQYQDF